MKWLSAVLTFVNVTTVCGCLEGIAAHGLSKTVAASSVIAGVVAALLAFWGTDDSPEEQEAATATNGSDQNGAVVIPQRRRRYGSIWLWAMVAIFVMFAFRSFCNVYFIDGNEYKIQNPNNLGDLSLHITYIKNFANGVAMWPDNPIYYSSRLRYPAGIDLFNAILLCLDISVIRGLVWVGLGASAALCYLLYRWGGTFTMAGFLFNGGVAGWQWFRNYEWKDYQTSNYIAWKSLALTMLVTQRGLLYALPAGLLLLCHWRSKFFAHNKIEPLPPSPSSSSSSSSSPSSSSPSSSATLEPTESETAVADPAVADPVGVDPIVADPVTADAIVAADPIAADPIVSDPVVADSIVAEPAVAEPAVGDSVVANAVATETVVADTVVAEPAVAVDREAGTDTDIVADPDVAVAPAAPVVTPALPVPPAVRGILPFWVELSIYATMPLFHVHTFMALSFVLFFLFLFLAAPARKQLFFLGALAFLPATLFLYLITDHFHAGSVMSWNPGWVMNNGDFAKPLAAFTSQPATVPAPGTGFGETVKHFFEFWFLNFGITVPLLIALVVVLTMRAWKHRGQPATVNVRLVALVGALVGLVIMLAALFAYLSLHFSLFVVLAIIPPVALALMIPLFAALLQRSWRQTIPLSTPLAFVIPAVVLFIFSCLVKTAPWEWDNIKLIIWSYLIMLPFLWSEVMARWAFPIRAVVCIALFGSGFLTLFGGLAAGRTGYGMSDRAELDAVGMAIRQIPLEARFAGYPTFNHPLLLQGRKMILGYPGHIWTQGLSYGDDMNKLGTLMNGAPDWRQTADHFQARYLFWGREEIKNYGQSRRPWEQECKLVVSGPWGSIYDLKSPREPAPVQAPSPTQAPVQGPSPTPAPSK